uniref:Uncharacterized protein n=1 Tax=Ciona intestinalis TaxID=7719 RepID=H2XZN0_CIOIN
MARSSKDDVLQLPYHGTKVRVAVNLRACVLPLIKHNRPL